MQTFVRAVQILSILLISCFGNVCLSWDEVKSLADETQGRILKDDAVQERFFSLSLSFCKSTLFVNIGSSVILKNLDEKMFIYHYQFAFNYLGL